MPARRRVNAGCPRMLAGLGFSSEIAEDGLEALAMLERRGFDAVLMDCQMPTMDGYAATEELRRREAHAPGGAARRTPVIAMTASATSTERERCLAVGMDDFVSKPVSRQTLDAALSRWLAPR